MDLDLDDEPPRRYTLQLDEATLLRFAGPGKRLIASWVGRRGTRLQGTLRFPSGKIAALSSRIFLFSLLWIKMLTTGQRLKASRQCSMRGAWT